MHVILYKFQVKDEEHEQFITAWKQLTIYFREYSYSLGSRLHKQNENTYLAYAQWPDKPTSEKANAFLPKEASKVSLQMRNACKQIKVIDRLEVVADLLV